MPHVESPGETLDSAVVRAWAGLAVEALGGARGTLDGANVFPVADGDTGTNMYLTLREGAHAVRMEQDGADGSRLLRLLARGALLGARGNSGSILSEWLRGLAASATRGESLADALEGAARTARRAVAHPAPGTILTAADAAAAAARESAGLHADRRDPGARRRVLDAARRGARDAALASGEALPALRDAGVLDSGAAGLLLVLHALAESQRRADRLDMPSAPVRAQGRAAVSEASGNMLPVTLDIDLRGPGAPVPAAEADDDEVELMFVLHRPVAAAEYSAGGVAEELRRDLDVVGGSVVVVGGSDSDPGSTEGDAGDDDTLWQAHVHTSDLGAALGVAQRWAAHGTVSHVHVRDLASMHTAGRVPRSADGTADGLADELATPSWGMVAVTGAPGLAGDLARGGAVVLVQLDAPVTAEDLAAAALGHMSRQVVVLPGPVRGTEEGLAAAMAGPGADDDTGAAAGSGASVVVLEAVTDAQVAVAAAALAVTDDADAARDALVGLRVARTDAVGAPGVLDSLIGAAEPVVVTALLYDSVPPRVVELLTDQVARRAPDAELVVLACGLPGDAVVLAVEVER